MAEDANRDVEVFEAAPKPPNPDVVRPNIKSQTDEISNDFVDVGMQEQNIEEAETTREGGYFCKNVSLLVASRTRP